MVFKYLKYSCRFLNTINISKLKMNVNKCYFRELKNEIHITFLFKIDEGNIRQFNFTRKPEESISVIITRISANIQKIFNKTNKKKKNNKEISGSDVKLYDNEDKILADNTTCKDLITSGIPIKLQILDQLFEVQYNTPWVNSISLPQSMLAGFPVYPIGLEILFGDKEHSKFDWYSSKPVNEKGNIISEAHLKWDYVGEGYTYTPTTQDVGKIIKLLCTPANETQIGPVVEAKSINPVEAGPGKCPFETRHLFTATKLKNKRCVTYNILADLYCDSDFTRTVLHPYCPPYALHIDYRKQLLIKELLGYNSDITCLQEVDVKIYKNVLEPILSQEYDGVFSKKGKETAEGLACFYRKDRFKLISHSSIVLAESLNTEPCFSQILNVIKHNTPLMDTLCNRSTVVMAAILQSLDNPENVLVVGNTHLYFHPVADHIRLIQGGMIVYWLNKLLNDTQAKMPSSKVSLILCGDFNSVPSCGIYKLYTEGVAPENLEDWKSNKEEAVVGLSLKQDIPLKSACGTPKYTNYTAGFADCLDYIFYDTRNMDVEQVIPFPSEEELSAHIALPSIVFPSDHIASIADLTFK